ncbi:hypothetical protein ACROYT_G015516 [Oculina patagonica]
MRISNGRVIGDLDGKLTSYQTNGASTVDYGIVSEDLQDTVLGFQVQALTPYSDHCPITLKLASRNRDIINNASKNSQRKETFPQNSFTKFLWKLESKDKFISALSRIDIQDKLQSFNTAHHSSIDDEISQFNQILKSVAKRSLVPSRKTRKHTKKHKPWYDNTCRQLKKKLQKLVKEINPTAPQSLRQEYFAVKKKYKKLVKQMHKRYKNQLLNEINALKSNQSGDFWKLINKIRKNETVEESSDISSEDWINHFQNLLYDKAQESHGENVTSPNNPDQTTTKTDEILDAPITAKEIHDQISKLKNKKASGTDAILNEMIKHGRYYLMPSLERIFNNIIEKGTFPTEWNIGVIKPIYKQKGDKKSPANYRGITLTSCLGKLFTSILQNRLNKFIEQHDVLNPEQFGFRPNSRTTDSLFIFQQLLHKYTKQHKKLYVGFIDYEKAFDSVWQSGMIHKLQTYGIQGKFLNVIKSMYSSIRSCVKINQNALTELFSCNKGIRQGDGLSPVLFSLFMNDLPQYLKQSKSPGVMLGNRTINCLMYADDLLIISPSPEGLQQSLNVIHRHAQQWKLKVNTKKSNIIIFSGNGQNKNNINFKYDNESLQIVDKQTYLGIEMTSSGRYTYAREILSKKATKVLSIIKRSFSNTDSAAIAIKNKLFNALVKPVLLYACEIWGPELLSYKTHFDKSTIEQVHIKFCKQTLNVPWYTENIACRAELGRYPLIIDIKTSIFSYWQRLKYCCNNVLLSEAFQYATTSTTFFDVATNEEMHQETEPITRQHIKNGRLTMRKTLRNKYSQNWLGTQNSSSSTSREKFTHKEVKKSYEFENYLTSVKNPAHRISLTKLRLGCHTLRIQTGKYENKGASIPVEQRTCLPDERIKRLEDKIKLLKQEKTVESCANVLLALRRHLNRPVSRDPSLERTKAAAYIMCYLLIEAGYFIGLDKSQLVPSTWVRFLGFVCDSVRQAFLVSKDKKVKFAAFRDILSSPLTWG